MSTDDPRPARASAGAAAATDWQEQFIGELRMRDVSGPRIGDALAEVDSYCADAGQSAQEAFGDPVEYAEMIAMTHAAEHARPAPVKLAWYALRVAGLLAGIFLAIAGAVGVSEGRDAVITAGVLVSVVLGGIALPVVAVNRRALLTWRSGLTLMVPVCAAILLPPLWRAEVLRLPAGWALGCGLLVTVAGYWPVGRSRLRDPIVDPRDSEAAGGAMRRLGLVLIGGPLVVFLVSIALLLSRG